MYGKVSCIDCEETLGIYEDAGVAYTDIELHREFIACSQGHHNKRLDVYTDETMMFLVE